jgi:hypothetical protein
MKKYEELLIKYSKNVDRIRHLKKLADEKLAIYKEHDKKPVDWKDELAVADHEIVGHNLYKDWQTADDDYKIECERMTNNLNEEYSQVPFPKTAEQGIEKFWDLVFK